MNITPVQPAAEIDTSTVPIEDLAGNKHLTRQQKIHEASRQFEAIMLQQILSEMQKPVITSESTDDSTAAGIYQDYTTNALAQSMSKTDSLGFARIFEQQLSPHTSKPNPHALAVPSENPAVKKTGSVFIPSP
jgi:Rod binding domain-containing protein